MRQYLDIGILFCILNRFHLYSVSPAHPITPKTKSPRHHKKKCKPQRGGRRYRELGPVIFFWLFFLFHRQMVQVRCCRELGSWQFLFCFSMVFGNFLHLYQPNKIENNESTQYWLWRDRDGALIPNGAKKRLLLAVRVLYLYFFKLRDPLFLRRWWSPGSLIL